MATLQKIRSKGPLLLIVIGLAMLAFILGDAWKIIRPNQGVQYIGSIDGKKVSAMDFQNELENYSEVVRFSSGLQDLTEEQNNQIKDEVWSVMVRRAILQKETDAIGLTVTEAEVRDVIEKGTDPVLQNTPFNGSDGKFDLDYLKTFLAVYKDLDPSVMSVQDMRQYDAMYKYWLYIEDNIKSNLLYSKYISLVTAGLISNPVVAKDSYETRVMRSDVVLASIPYSRVSDSTVTVTTADMKKAYADNKELLFNYSENRDIYYIDAEILPSDADRKALLAEMNELTTQLTEADAETDFGALLRRAGSDISFSEVPRSAAVLPEDVVERLDSVGADGVFGPYYNLADDTYNSFRVLSKESGYDSIQFSVIQIATGKEDEDIRISDSIVNALKRGGSFTEIAARYSQSGESDWLVSEAYEPASISGDNAVYLNKVNSMKKDEIANVRLTGGNLIIKVDDVRNKVDKYNLAVIKRQVEFSDETSNNVYNALSQFVAANKTLDDLKENAEDSDFRLLYYPSFESYSYNVGGVPRSHEALRWLFEANEGEVSRIFEAGQANEHLMVVAVDKIHPQGYRSIKDAGSALRRKAINEKKFESLKSRFDGASSVAELRNTPGVSIDTIQYVNFNNSAYLSSYASNESTVGPTVSKLARDVLSKPMQGENCIYVAQKISPDSYPTEYDAEAETARLNSISSRQIANSLLQELYFQAHIEDTRYKVF
ncbi:MAG: SurA N-terminal domain-containing protein [Bacteroidaceae bacterium]|nr:SurA N-terminal domain-containing protein [Bacteroidaceae bacterium]